jgi:type IX secretion system PorP/SprF family membrane protein
MNRYILSITILLAPLQLLCQMPALTDHYLNNTLAFNPAFAGCQDALSVSVLYRNQWVGFEDAPRNSNVSLHTPLRNDRVGLGLMIENSSYGINEETSFTGCYAYRMEMQNGMLALGLGFGVTVKHVAWDELKAADSGDILLMNNPESAVLPDFSLGMYYYSRKYFFGFSLPRLLSHEIDQSTGKYRIKNDFSEYNYFLEGGYYFDLTPQIKLLPSLLLKYHPGHVPQADINAQVILKERLWLGIGYRNKNTFLGMLQCQLNKQIMIAYSYSFDTGSAGTYNKGSHEVVLNYLFSYSRKVAGPRQY